MEVENKIREYSNLVYRIAYSMTKKKTDAEDIYQEVFIKFFKNIKKLKDQQHEKRWLIRVTMNECNMLYRKKSVRNEVELDENTCAPYNNEYQTSIHSYIKKLPYKYEIVIYLYYFEGYKIEEIAKILKTTSGTIKSRLSRAKKQLKEMMGEDFDEE